MWRPVCVGGSQADESRLHRSGVVCLKSGTDGAVMGSAGRMTTPSPRRRCGRYRTPPMMTCVLIIGSRHIRCSRSHHKSHVETQTFSEKRKQRKLEGKWIGYVGEEKKRLTLSSQPFRSLQDSRRTA
ncbi:hypothetical protein JOB18_020413 [Solea senegalensis]|uniref:Uncharacterized protein n=1 Tax=Solea senegalensis TaxID=28829 RepID=A0AAV6R7S1_SOLSE|nr:hypothetical protein JOB18_020413 [Solea senegalensis]